MEIGFYTIDLLNIKKCTVCWNLSKASTQINHLDFKVLDLKHGKSERPKNITSIELTNCYTSPLPINHKKNKDLLSLLPLMHEGCYKLTIKKVQKPIHRYYRMNTF